MPEMRKFYNNRFTRPWFNPVMRRLAWYEPVRRLVNLMHNRLSYSQREAFFWSFASAFRDFDSATFKPGSWQADFNGVQVAVPLLTERLWEDWGIAIGLLGHDASVKQTYANILSSSRRPDVFVDIGANYGTHSLLMAKAGVKTYSFEPNPYCHAIAKALLDANNVAVQWHQVALGRQLSSVQLRFPKGDTSLGSVAGREIAKAIGDIVEVNVQQRRLDDYRIEGRSVLVKLDVEGHEIEALFGSSMFISRLKPMIVFESNRDDGLRSTLLSFLVDRDFGIYHLPWHPDTPGAALSADDFLQSAAVNFIALPVVGDPE